MRPTPRECLIKAIEIAGSESKLAKLLKAAGFACTQNRIWQAKKRGVLTAELAMQIEKVTEGQLKARDMCPDLPWPACTDSSSAEATP